MDNVNYEVRYAMHPDDVRHYDTSRIRKEFLVEKLMESDKINMVYTMIDRMVVGGAVPAEKSLKLEAIDPLKASYFLERREFGTINVGGKGKVTVDGETFEMDTSDALYIGRGKQEIYFESTDKNNPARFYFNSALAHTSYPAKKVTLDMAEVVNLGSQENSSVRSLNKMIAGGIVDTCQLQMGITILEPGSVWNTMPVHKHERRMEAYFYFDLPEDQTICHIMGDPKETRHIWLQNEQAVISPSWSIHAAAGTSSYKFIWGMAGENKEFGDMDGAEPVELR
jgi:4-deoxy-L-threo-5-hexosulose-uronate ketol-isomerase